MSDAAAAISREEQIAAEHMELELAAAKRVHARLMAAEETDDINSLGRTWQRVARSLRQSVALKAKLTRDREADARAAAQVAALPRLREAGPAAPFAPLQRDHIDRIDRVAEAARPYFEREGADWDERLVTDILIDLARDGELDELSDAELIDRLLEILGDDQTPGVADDDGPTPPEGEASDTAGRHDGEPPEWRGSG